MNLDIIIDVDPNRYFDNLEVNDLSFKLDILNQNRLITIKCY